MQKVAAVTAAVTECSAFNLSWGSTVQTVFAKSLIAFNAEISLNSAGPGDIMRSSLQCTLVACAAVTLSNDTGFTTWCQGCRISASEAS
jgi:hypothetical protein